MKILLMMAVVQSLDLVIFARFNRVAGLSANQAKNATAKAKERDLRYAAFCVHQWICGGR